MLDSRELAALIWIAIAFVALLFIPQFRSTLPSIASSLKHRSIWIAFLLMVAWVSLLVFVGHRSGIWDIRLIKETLLWFFGSAVVLVFRSNKAAADPRFFRRASVSAIEWAALLSFFVNYYVFPFTIEFVLQPLIASAILIEAFSSLKHKVQCVKRVCDVFLIGVGLSALMYGAFRLVHEWPDIDWMTAFLEIALPAWLTIGLLPFIFAFSLYMGYEWPWKVITLTSQSNWKQLRALLAMATVVGFRPTPLNSLNQYWAGQIVGASSLVEARHSVREFITWRGSKT